MAAIENSRSLLGGDDKVPGRRWKEDIAPCNYRRRLIWAATLLLIPLTIIFVFYQQWNFGFESSAPGLSRHQDHAQESGNERDLKWLLHPEDHVFRASGTRRFSWNITKATIAPNGVEKNVFLINGTTNFHLIIWSGSTHEIEQINFLVLRLRRALVMPSRLRCSTLLKKKYPSTGMAYT